MDELSLIRKIDELRTFTGETECVEFKRAADDFDLSKLARYFSALANEANLRKQLCAWLVLGIQDTDRKICGTNYLSEPAKRERIKQQIAEKCGGFTFREIHVVDHPEGRVLMFEIPPAPHGIPVSCDGHYHGRNGESLAALSVDKLDQIRGTTDWSVELCPNAQLDALDPAAVSLARRLFVSGNQQKSFAHDIATWSDAVFLDRAKFTVQGKLTRACLLLLGRPESRALLGAATAEIVWKLEGHERASEFFHPPFLLTTSELYSRIRNTIQKIDVPGRLVPYEVPKYEKWVILECLHNALAHQDYHRQSRILVTETPEELVIESAGGFFDGCAADYVLGRKTPMRYRNKFLVDAMVAVNMIDSMGYGIHKMFLEQRKRFYPLPDFSSNKADAVVVRIPGRVIDAGYTALLMEKQDLALETVILLDQVQKRRSISKADAAALRRAKLVEGRFPNLFVAANVAVSPGEKAKYIRNRAFDDGHFREMILTYLRTYGHASRAELDELLLDKLSEVLTHDQKMNKIRNLRTSLVEAGLICNTGSRRSPVWTLVTPHPSLPGK
jgi:ATP-dependent DNA helicase RecG